jgi:hypothetical protein
MARAPVSKSDWFASNFKAHSEKIAAFTFNSINRLVLVSEGPCEVQFANDWDTARSFAL